MLIASSRPAQRLFCSFVMMRPHPSKFVRLNRVFPFSVLGHPVYDTRANKTFYYLKDRNYRHPLKRLSSVISLRSPEIAQEWLCDWTRRLREWSAHRSAIYRAESLSQTKRPSGIADVDKRNLRGITLTNTSVRQS